CSGGFGGVELPPGVGSLPGEHRQRCEMVAALPDDWERGGEGDGRASSALVGGAGGLVVVAVVGRAGRDASGAGGRVRRARGGDELRLGLADRAPRWDQLQKNAVRHRTRSSRRRTK